jgi:cytochrome P450
MTAPSRLHGLSEQVHKALAVRLDPTAVSEGHDELAELVLGRWLCVLFDALGVPTDDWVQVARWAEGAGPAALDALGDYVDVMVGARCATPTDDLLSDLITAEVDGDGFTADELRAIVVALVTT